MATKRTGRPSTDEKRAEKRPERIPVSGARNILTVTGIDTENYIQRWVNDVDDRIERFKQGGWEFVTDDVNVGDRVADTSKSDGTIISKYVGANRTAYLMQIKREWFEEDQATKAKAVKESEEALFQAEKNGEGRYGSVSTK